jgi:FG-GAP-like repeat
MLVGGLLTTATGAARSGAGAATTPPITAPAPTTTQPPPTTATVAAPAPSPGTTPATTPPPTTTPVPLKVKAQVTAQSQFALTQIGPFQSAGYSAFYANPVHEAFSGVAAGDLFGDGNIEFVSGAIDGWVRVYNTSGTVVRAIFTGGGPVYATPTLYDLNGDGRLDIITANAGTGWVVGYDALTGGQLFSQLAPPLSPGMGVFATPVVGDLDGDGQPEVVVTSWNTQVYAWHLNGQLVAGFPVFLYDTLWSSPALADLDGDGHKEIVFGGDISNYPTSPYKFDGGLVWAIRSNGQVQPGFPILLPGQTIWSSPAVADINGDGSPDIVVGTGLNFPNTGSKVYAFDRFGHNLPGWPVATGGRVMASPAIGNLFGDPTHLGVAVMDEAGFISAYTSTGYQAWVACGRDGGQHSCAAAGPHGAVSIADVNNDGQQDVVGMAEHYMQVFDGATGVAGTGMPEAQAVSDANTSAPASPPTIVSVSNRTWIVQATTHGNLGPGGQQFLWIWSTGTPLGAADWPTFHQNMSRTGTMLDSTKPTASVNALAPSQSSTRFTVAWSGNDSGTGVSRFEVDSKSNGLSWTRWQSVSPTSRSGSDAGGSASFFGLASMDYQFRVRAVDGAGNVGAWSATSSTAVAFGATQVQPFTQMYAVTAQGYLSWGQSAPQQGPNWGWSIARGIVARSAGGGYILDGWGGVHAFGGAPGLTSTAYWPGWDIARGIALNPDGMGGYVLDGWGGLHRFGNAAAVSNNSYWQGWDVARGVVLMPTSTATHPRGYTLDAFGGIHRFGEAPQATGGTYWPGWAIARAITMDPDGHGGYVLDAYGGLHAFNGAPGATGGPYWAGWDIARSVAMIKDGNAAATKGYVLDGFGGTHPFGGAPAIGMTPYWGADFTRALAISN